jgi:hypothetical protein
MLLAILVVLGSTLSPGRSSAHKPAKPLYWGAIIGSQYTGTPPPWDMNAAQVFGESVGKSPSLLQFSLPFSECTPNGKHCSFYGFPTEAMQSIRQFGAIPVLNWGSQSVPTKPDEPAYRLNKVAKGKYDKFLHHFAEDAAQWGHPFFLRFNWEMNGFWFPWSPGINHNTPHDFIASWRHVHKIFQEEGATNANWVWCPNVDFTRKLTPLKTVYPGSKYVDWSCLDGFNWGKTSNSAGWMTFNEIFKSTYERMLKIVPDKPMMIGEVASEERGGSKPAWIRNLLKVVPQEYPKVRAMLWFNYKDQAMNWPLTSSQAATNAFAKGIQPAHYVANVYSGIQGPKIEPPTWYAPPPEPPAPIETPAPVSP